MIWWFDDHTPSHLCDLWLEAVLRNLIWSQTWSWRKVAQKGATQMASPMTDKGGPKESYLLVYFPLSTLFISVCRQLAWASTDSTPEIEKRRGGGGGGEERVRERRVEAKEREEGEEGGEIRDTILKPQHPLQVSLLGKRTFCQEQVCEERGKDWPQVAPWLPAWQELSFPGPPGGISGIQSQRTDFNSDKGSGDPVGNNWSMNFCQVGERKRKTRQTSYQVTRQPPFHNYVLGCGKTHDAFSQQKT